jgi:hypothetical protein
VRYDRDFGNSGTSGVVVNPETGTATDGFDDTDTLISIELVRGTSQADQITGGNAASYGFEAYNGLGGNDTITGGGYDEARYDQDAAYGGKGAVNVNFVTGQATDGFGNIDTLVGIEGVRGTGQADTFTGDGRILTSSTASAAPISSTAAKAPTRSATRLRCLYPAAARAAVAPDPFGFRLFDFGEQFRFEDGTLYAIDACFVRD